MGEFITGAEWGCHHTLSSTKWIYSYVIAYPGRRRRRPYRKKGLYGRDAGPEVGGGTQRFGHSSSGGLAAEAADRGGSPRDQSAAGVGRRRARVHRVDRSQADAERSR